MARLLRIVDRIEALMAGMAILLLVGITGAVCMEVFMRYVLNDPIVWVVEISEYALLYICFLGTAWALNRGHHIRIDIFLGFFSPRMRRVLGMLSALLGLAVALVLVIWGLNAVWVKYLSGAYNPTVIEFPTWIVLACIPVGAFFLCVRFLRIMIGHATGSLVDRASHEIDMD